MGDRDTVMGYECLQFVQNYLANEEKTKLVYLIQKLYLEKFTSI